MITLENDYLKISISEKGAELHSLYNKADNIEQLWQADPSVWAWHAPNLFPVVGGCIDNTLFIDGKTFTMDRHGFARQSTFTLLASNNKYALFSLDYTSDTLIHYPFKFQFQLAYHLNEKKLSVTYRVINQDEKIIYFSVGGHPAFKVPFYEGEKYTDYYLSFPEDLQLTRHLLADSGLFNGNTALVPLTEQQLFLTKDLFSKDALVFKDLRSRKVQLKSITHAKSLSLTFPDFEYLGIWAKPGADFVCIEPWLGCADTEGRRVDISEKEAIQKLETGQTFEATFTIELND
jgi:galactose mutarotase-like enzyme